MDNPAVMASIAAICGVIGAVATQFLTTLAKRGEMEIGSETQLRREMAEQIAAQNVKIDKLAADGTEWQRRYWEEHTKLVMSEANQVRTQSQIDTLIADNTHLKERVATLEAELAAMKAKAMP